MPRAKPPVNVLALGFSATRNRGVLKRVAAIVFLYIALLWRSTYKVRIGDERAVGGAAAGKKPRNPLKGLIAAHLVLWHYVAVKAARATSLGAFIVRTLGTQAVSAPAFAVDFVSKQTVALQDGLQASFEKRIEQTLDIVAVKVKVSIKDDYMPVALQGIIDDAVDSLMPDIKIAVFERTDAYLATQSPLKRVMPPRRRRRRLRTASTSAAHDEFSDSESEVSDAVSDTEGDADEELTKSSCPRRQWQASVASLSLSPSPSYTLSPSLSISQCVRRTRGSGSILAASCTR